MTGAADRILTLTEKQSEHRMDLERSVVSGNLKQSKLGRWVGFCQMGRMVISVRSATRTRNIRAKYSMEYL
ncbi:MAG: DUF2335 domain-containing protein [Caldilineaceae bacterium SB0665_bin_25]|nr:DUF2335 domain-containing protein [Caldilineaceae bacterium SB0665_bin_25]MYF39021.1 DUF2335 domain-containing protein [Gammaproteobacteria bacterium]